MQRKGRKTITVAKLLDIHERFEQYAEIKDDLRVLRIFMDSVLLETNNYEGFSETATTQRYFRNDRTRG
ncbi:hypothetical protein LCGC14_1614400 [marine sediment metagenome]|uniref:Uncharacterized protein n=1 Tax=marine sediment metagenome TaxID=412755 RepID=A0A0F9L7K6_9ZZZZ